MAKISQLPSTTEIGNNDQLTVLQGGVLKRSPWSLLTSAASAALTAVITTAASLLDTKVAAAQLYADNAAASATAASGALRPIGGSLRFPYDNTSQFPLQEGDIIVSDVGSRGFVAQSFGNRTTPILKFGVTSCYYSAYEKDDRLYPAVEMYIAGSHIGGLGWSIRYYTASWGSSEALRRQRRRFRVYINGGSGRLVEFWTRQVPISWRRFALAVHRNPAGLFQVDVHNLMTGEILAGTGTDDATFVAELSATNPDVVITQHGNTGVSPSMFGVGAIIINDAVNATLAQPLTQSYSSMSHGLTFYAEQAVSNAALQAIHAGAHPTTVIATASIKWLRWLNASAASLAKDPLCTADTSVPAVLYGHGSPGSNLFGKGPGTATIDPAPRARYIYGLRKGQQVFRRPISGRCWPTEASFVDVMLIDRNGTLLKDWTPVASVEVSGSWQGYTNKVAGTGATATGTYALGITGNGTGATGRFTTAVGGGVGSIFVDTPGSGYTAMTLDFSAAPGLTGASATAVLEPINNSYWSGFISAPAHHDWTLAQVRLRTKSGAVSESWLEAGQWAPGGKYAVDGQSQVANGLSSADLRVQYKGPPANLVRAGTVHYISNLPPIVDVEPLGQRIGADQYKALANMLARWSPTPFEIVVAGQGGTGPIDLIENLVVDNQAVGMWDMHEDVHQMAGADWSGAVMAWHTDLTDEGGQFASKMLDGLWLGRGPNAYAAANHVFARAKLVGTTMTVTSVRRGTLSVGTTIRIMYDYGGKQTARDTKITALGTGTGGTGTYTLSEAVPGGDPANEVSIIGLHEQPGVDPVFTGYISGGSIPTLTVTAVTSGTLQIGDRILTTAGGQLDASTYIKIMGTGTGGTGTYVLSKSNGAVGSAGAPVQFKAVRGTGKKIITIMDVFPKGTPIFYMPPTRHNTTSGAGPYDYDQTSISPYIEGVRQGGVGAARDNGIKWAKDRGLPVGTHAIDYTQPDPYHPDNTVTGKVRVGRHMALTIAKAQGLVDIGQPAVIATSGRFTDGTRSKYQFQVDCPNFGRLRSGDGLGNVTPCIELSRDNGATWSRSKHTAAVNPLTGGTLPTDTVEVTITDPTYRVAGLRYRVLAGGPFAWGTDGSPTNTTTVEAEANDAAINKMLYEEFDILTDIPGLCVAPSQSAYPVAEP